MIKKLVKELEKGLKLLIVGPTNAGKSSLLNYLSRREVAIVSGNSRDNKRCYRNSFEY